MENAKHPITKKDFLNDLYLFYRYFITSNYASSVPAPHIKALSRKLMELHEGVGKHRLAVSMPPRHPADINTPIYTVNKGWIKHGELEIGDIVLNHRYKTTEVVNVLPRVPVDNCLVFSNGDKIVCGDEHLWLFHDYVNDETRLFTTREIMNRELTVGKSHLPNFKIPTPSKNISLIDAYKVEKRQGNCITVKAKDGMYLIGENRTPTHNSKSSMVTLAFPLWLIFQNPNLNIMIVTGSPKLAEKFGIQLREYVRDLGKYFNVYLSQVKQASTHIMFCDRNNKLYKGNIMLASSGGGITGQDADYLILDDPYTGNDEEFTPSALQKKIDWVNRVIEQRIEPHTKYCILHTRWHPLADDTPVYTVNKGWTTHGELEVGDTLLGTNRKHTNVVKVHPKTKSDNCLIFSNGDSIVCGDEHLWRFHNETTNETKIYTTYEVMQEDLFYKNAYLSNFKIPVNKSEYVSLIGYHKVPSVESNCITVDAYDGMYLVGRNLTPTHNSNDIIGYYKESDPNSYDFIEFPAIQEDGTALWKERYTVEELLKKKEVVGERVFQSIYQQQPIDMTSDFFNMPMLKYGLPQDYDENYTTKVRAWDIASSDALTRNDFTAGVLMYRYDDYAIIQDLVHGRFGNNTKNIVVRTAEQDTPNVKVVVETGVASAGKLLYQEWENQLTGYMVERAEVTGGKSKVDRATPLRNAIEDGKVYVNITDPVIRQVFYDELTVFPNGKHDDITDATAHSYNSLFMEGMGKKRPRPKIGVVFL